MRAASGSGAKPGASNSSCRCWTTCGVSTGAPAALVISKSLLDSALFIHHETKPSFYVNARKNLFYCHGCGRGGDLIRWIQLSLGLSFRESVEHLKRELGQAANPPAALLEQTAAFYQCQLQRHAEAAHYLAQRGLRDPDLIQVLRIGYAPGENLRGHLAGLGYCLDLLLQAGLINHQGRDAFCRRLIFPCPQQGRVINLYGRSIGTAFPHRFLPRPKGACSLGSQ